jgi:hypothetical protein
MHKKIFENDLFTELSTLSTIKNEQKKHKTVNKQGNIKYEGEYNI